MHSHVTLYDCNVSSINVLKNPHIEIMGPIAEPGARYSAVFLFIIIFLRIQCNNPVGDAKQMYCIMI